MVLKGISPCLSPELLAELYKMGHGDAILLADAHFPGHTVGKDAVVLRADGLDAAALLHGILPLFELDSYVDSPVVVMAPVAGDSWDPVLMGTYRHAIATHAPGFEMKVTALERFAFYEAAKRAAVNVMTGELRKYGNIMLVKGVTPT
eukprot:Colp12_sorted_trinity150504_noHs@34711